MKTSIETKIIIAAIIVFISMSVSIIFLWKGYQHEKSERARYQNNYTALASDRAAMQEITKKELKTFYSKFDSLANAFEIKTRNIKDIVTISYRIKDTTVKSYQLTRDSVTASQSFLISRPCYQLQGQILNDSIRVTSYTAADNLTLFLHRKPTRRIWFIKWKYIYTAAAYSECKQDTIAVTNFLHIK